MPARSREKVKKSKVAEDQPVFHWLVLGEGENERRFAVKPGEVSSFLMGQMAASHTLSEMWAAQYTFLQNSLAGDDWLELHAFLAGGGATMDEAVDALFKAYSDRPTVRPEPSSDGSGLGPETSEASTDDPASDDSSDDSALPEESDRALPDAS